MTGRRGVLSGMLLAAFALCGERSGAQVSTKAYDVSPTVFAEHIEAVFPGPYFLQRKPNPPVRGFYAWKLVFGERDVTVVFRTDSALAMLDTRLIVRSGALYRCEWPEQPMLECATRINGSARAGSLSVTLDITDTSVVRFVRTRRPTIVTRQWFEPGGRFRVDQVGVGYRDPTLR